MQRCSRKETAWRVVLYLRSSEQHSLGGSGLRVLSESRLFVVSVVSVVS